MKLFSDSHGLEPDVNNTVRSIQPPPPSKLFGNVQEVETAGVVSLVNYRVAEDGSSAPADLKGKEVVDQPSEAAGGSGSNSSTPRRRLEDHNVGGSEGHAILNHIESPEHTERSSGGIRAGLHRCFSTIATFVLSVMSAPYQFLVQMFAVLSSAVSLYSGFRADPHEPLRRRITELEIEVDRLKPLQEELPKLINPVDDPAEKLSMLETELSNTRKTLRSVLSKQQELQAVLQRMKEFKCLHVQEKCW